MSSLNNIPLIRPYVDESVKQRVLEVLESGFLTEGSVTRKFEQKVAEYVGAKYTIAVNSCTTGLELALRALEVGPGDEVIVPDYTYPATANVVSIVGATPVLVDVSRDTMLIDYDRLEQAITEYTKAIIPVSLFGNPLEYDRLNEIKSRYGLPIIEDAACAMGASYKGLMVGSLADITVFSFHPRKFITTGEGGMVTTNNEKWANWMISYKHFGMKSGGRSRADVLFKMTGTNYKMSDVLAAIGLAQMEIVDALLSKRRQLAHNYISMLSEVSKVTIPQTTHGGNHSYQSFCIYIPKRDKVMKQMRDAGIETQIGTYSLHTQPAFEGATPCRKYAPFSGSEFAYNKCLTLPLYHSLNNEHQAHIVAKLQQFLRGS
ncbi:MAG TPA: DegT/DnrJ/EryC1/StrS aminotransferase family protein [Deltaproteobacteria bacterium]|nr:DegT/DnrJ/EryC1/StrS aminotransferase family protein [Deltaproteobacteria bacterium]